MADRVEARDAAEKASERVDGNPSSSPPLDPNPNNRSPFPCVLVLFRGLPGVGKSTLARRVARELGNAPLVDKDDTRDALAEVFSAEEGEGEERGSETLKQKLNEASYAAAFNAARTLLASSRCPIVLLDSPLSRASTAERALRLAEELERDSSLSLLFVVVVVGTADEPGWRRRLEARAAALEGSGSFSARHKPRRWEEVVALRDRGRRELEGEARKTEKKANRGGEGDGEEEEREGEGENLPFGERMLRDLGVEQHPPRSSPFSRLWERSSARFVVDTSSAGGEEEEETDRGEEEGARSTLAAAAKKVAAAVRSALAGGKRSSCEGNSDSSVIFVP